MPQPCCVAGTPLLMTGAEFEKTGVWGYGLSNR